MNNLNIFDYTQLAEASYANFWDSKTNQFFTAIVDIQNSLAGNEQEKIKGSGFSLTQAKQLTDHWSVLAQYRDRTEESSFSATLFKLTLSYEVQHLALEKSSASLNTC
jgi:hypothetical protein